MTKLLRMLKICGCPLIAYKMLSAAQLDLYFELPIAATLAGYASMLESHLELTSAAHLQMATLCNLYAHTALLDARTVPIRLLIHTARRDAPTEIDSLQVR